MNNFTEKLNAGRLYYVKKKNGDVCIRQAHLYSCLRTEKAMPFVDFDDNYIEKVIAPVPSYEELQALKKENENYCERNKILIVEKSRLREWLEFIATMQWGELKDCQKYTRQALDGSEAPK